MERREKRKRKKKKKKWLKWPHGKHRGRGSVSWKEREGDEIKWPMIGRV